MKLRVLDPGLVVRWLLLYLCLLVVFNALYDGQGVVIENQNTIVSNQELLWERQKVVLDGMLQLHRAAASFGIDLGIEPLPGNGDPDGELIHAPPRTTEIAVPQPAGPVAPPTKELPK